MQLYGIEAVGRKCSVMQSRSGAKAWEKAQILEFNPDNGQHKLRYSSSKAEEWLCLGDIKFKWSQLLPPTAPANPSYRAEFAREAGVGRRLRVYWPAMQRWYQGTVRSHDAKTDRHVVLYKDGDTQSLQLKHEPVIWSDDEAVPAAANGISSGADQQQQQQHPGQLLPPLAIGARHSGSTAVTPRAAGASATPRANASSAAAGSASTSGRPAAAAAGANAGAKRGVSPRAPMSPRSAAAAAAAAVALSFAGTSSKAKLNRMGSRSGGAGGARPGVRQPAAAGAGAAGAAKHAAYAK
jgi:hypothetical protein